MSLQDATELAKALTSFPPVWAFAIVVGAILAYRSPNLVKEFRRRKTQGLVRFVYDGPVERSPVAGTYLVKKEFIMAIEPKRPEPDIPPQKPDIQPEPKPEEIPQNKDVPEKEAPPMQL